MENWWRWLFLALLLLLSFFFSSAENTFTTVDRYRIERDTTHNKRYSHRVQNLIKRYDDTVLTILFGNNVVNVSLTAIAAGLAIELDAVYGGTGQYFALIMGILIVALILFGEIIPKTFGLKFNYRLAYFYVMPYLFFYYVSMPLLFPFRLFNKTMRNKKATGDHEDDVYTEDELQIIVDEIEEHGLIDKETSGLVRSAIELTETEAYEIMTPRVDIFSFDIDDDIYALMRKQEIFKYSRIPVYADTIDNIIGILSTKDLIKLMLSKKKINIRSLISPPLFVHHSKNISEILTEFKASKNHIAVVIDEYGGTEGIVTLEDILEEVIGEIWDESDDIDEPIVKLADNHYLISGGLNIEDFFELFDLEEDEDNDYDTVAGWCVEMLDRFAKVGDTFTYASIVVKILAIDGFVVEKIEVTQESAD